MLSSPVVGDGLTALFWEDRWLEGSRIQDIAPRVYAKVPPRKRHGLTVQTAIQEGFWPRNINPNLDLDELREYVNLWHRVAIIQHQPDSLDMLSWAWESNGTFYVRSAYAAKFVGRVVSPTADFSWR